MQPVVVSSARRQDLWEAGGVAIEVVAVEGMVVVAVEGMVVVAGFRAILIFLFHHKISALHFSSYSTELQFLLACGLLLQIPFCYHGTRVLSQPKCTGECGVGAGASPS